MIQTKLKGMGVALITPFKEDESVDYDALMRLVDYLLQNNADFLCVLGTTAETPTLTEEEKKTIKKMVIDRVNGRIPILLGVGGNNTRNNVVKWACRGRMRQPPCSGREHSPSDADFLPRCTTDSPQQIGTKQSASISKTPMWHQRGGRT